MSIILLISQTGKISVEDAKAFDRLTEEASRAKKRGEPLIVKLAGYDVYLSLGMVLTRVESDIVTGVVKLEVTGCEEY